MYRTIACSLSSGRLRTLQAARDAARDGTTQLDIRCFVPAQQSALGGAGEAPPPPPPRAPPSDAGSSSVVSLV